MLHLSHTQFYNHPGLYNDVLGEDSKGEVAYYTGISFPHKKILYLGPGTGRLLKHLASNHNYVFGVESSRAMSKKCQQNVPLAHIINKNILYINLKDKFNLVLAPFEFLNHFEPAILKKVLQIVYHHLLSDGIFIGQLKNPFLCTNKSHQSELDYVNLVKGKYFEKGYVTINNSNQTYTDFIERTNLANHRTVLIEMNWYYYLPEQLTEVLEDVGFQPPKLFGDFFNSAFGTDSPLLLFETNKSNSSV